MQKVGGLGGFAGVFFMQFFTQKLARIKIMSYICIYKNNLFTNILKDNVIMKAKITFNESGITMKVEIDRISHYSISFDMPKDCENPMAWEVLDKLGATISRLPSGKHFVIVDKQLITIDYYVM